MSQQQNFDQFLKQNFQSISNKIESPEFQPIHKKRTLFTRTWKTGVAAAACVFLLTGVAAAGIWQSWFDGGAVDKGLQHAEELGKVQHPATTVTDQGITVNVQSISTDALRTVLALQVNGNGANVLAIDDAILLDENQNEYALQKAVESGLVEFDPFKEGVTKGILKITSVSGQKGNWVLEFPVTRYASHAIEPKQTVELGDGNTLTIQKMEFSLTATKVDIVYNSPYKAIGMSVIENGVERVMTSYDRDQEHQNVGHYLLEPVEGTHPMTMVLKFEGRPEVKVEIKKS